MKLYRIKHIPTGLYYQPNRHIKNLTGEYIKSNLSNKGKIYHMKPSLPWIGSEYYNHLSSTKNRWGDFVSPFLDSEWEIEEVLP